MTNPGAAANAARAEHLLARYAQLRDGGLNRYDAAHQTGIKGGAADRYERAYLARRPPTPPRRRLIPEPLPRPN